MELRDACVSVPQRAQPAAVGRAGIWLAAGLMALLVLASIGGYLAVQRAQALDNAAGLSARRAADLAGELNASLAVATAAVLRIEARLAQLPAGQPAAGMLAELSTEHRPLLAALRQPLRLVPLGADGLPRTGDALALRQAETLPHAAGWQVGLTRGAPGLRNIPLLRRAAPNPHGIAAFLLEFDHAALVARLDAQRVPPKGGAALFRVEPDVSTTVLARAPLVEAEILRRLRGPLSAALARSRQGWFNAPVLLDGERRTVAFQRLDGDLDALAVAYGVADVQVLAAWRALLPWAAGVAVLLLCGIGAAARRLALVQQAQADQLLALQRSENQFRALANNLPDVVVRYDSKGRHLFANPAVEQASGLPSQAFAGKTGKELGMPAAQVALWTACLERVFASGQPERLEYDYPGPNGLRHWESLVVCEPPAPGAERTALMISRDMTDRGRMLQALQLSEQHLREAQQLASIGSWVLDMGSQVLEGSAEMFRIFEIDAPRSVATYETVLAVVHPDDRAVVDRDWKAAVAEHRDFTIMFRLLLQDGRIKHLQARGRCNYAADGTPLQALGTFQDITVRVQGEQALRDNEERLRLALQAANQGLYDLDLRTGEAVVSPEYATMLGEDPAQFHETNTAWRARLHPDDRPQVEQVYLDYVAGRRADYRVEFRQRMRDGGWKWILSIGRIQARDADGQPLRMLGTHTDLTDIKAAQAALQDSEARFRVLFDASPVPTLAYGRGSLRLLAVNEAFTQLSGYSRAEALALHIPDLYPPDLRDAMVALAGRVQGLNHVTDIQYVRKDGRRIDVETRSHDFAVDGRPARISVIVDVTEQRRAEAERRAAAERFQKLFEAAPEAISVSAVDGARFLLVNDAFCALVGYPREQVVGRTAADLQLWTEAPPREMLVQRLRAGEAMRDFEAVARRCDGQAVDLLFSAECIEFGGQEALLLMYRDVSERKRLDTALRASERRFRVAASFGQVWEWDFGAGGIAPSAEFFVNLGHGNVVGAQQLALFERIMHPGDLQRLRETLRLHLRREGPYHLEFRAFDAQGGTHWFETWGQALFDGPSGRARYIAGTTFEITERKQAEEQVRRLASELEQRVQERTAALVQSEARYRTIFETVPVAIIEEDWSEVQRLLRALRHQGVDDGPAHFATHPDFVQQCLRGVRVRRVNQKALALHDARSQRADLPDLPAFFPKPEDLPHFVGELEALWAGQRQYTAKQSLPSVTGRALSLMMSLSLPAPDDDDGTTLVCLVDITEIDRLNAELDLSVERLRKANKELETFTYSVSHDLKAPLRGIDGYSRLLLSEHADQLDDEGQQFLQHIRQATLHMAALIDDLLAYSRLERSELALAPLPVAAVVQTVLAGFRPSLDAAGAQVEVAIDPALRARADAQGLAMALRNLVDNALKFSRGSAPPRIRVTATRSQDGVELSVRDSGVGFDMKFHDRIYAIFQRLHRAEDYPGTGVGLAIVRKAMERMGGHVWARSHTGEGATFTLHLPEA